MTQKTISVLVHCPNCDHVHEIQINRDLLQKNVTQSDPWLSAKDAAKFLGISRRTLGTHISNGKIKATRVGKSQSSELRIRQSELERFRNSFTRVGS